MLGINMNVSKLKFINADCCIFFPSFGDNGKSTFKFQQLSLPPNTCREGLDNFNRSGKPFSVSTAKPDVSSQRGSKKRGVEKNANV